MLRITVATLALGLASPAFAQPVNPGGQCIETPDNAEAFVLARGIAEAVLPADTAEASMRNVMAAIGTQMRNAMGDELKDPALLELFDKRLDELPDRLMPVTRKFIPLQKAAMACAYTHEYSLAELREIKAFAMTPTGSHYLSSNIKLISDPAVAQANEGYFRDVQAVQQAFVADLQADVVAYTAKKKGSKGK